MAFNKTITVPIGKDRVFLASNKTYQILAVSIIQNINGGELYVSENDIDGRDDSVDLGDNCYAFNKGSAIQQFQTTAFTAPTTIYVQVGSTGCDVFIN